MTLTPKQHEEVSRVAIAAMINIATGFFVYAATLNEPEVGRLYVFLSIFACLATLVGALAIAVVIGSQDES